MALKQRKISARKVAILYLLAAPDGEGTPAAPIPHTTRLQKLLFLLKEQHLSGLDPEWWNLDFAYEAEKFGPADLDLYQDLEFLEAVGHITSGRVSSVSPEPSLDQLLAIEDAEPAPLEEVEESSALSFDYLIGGADSPAIIEPQETTRSYAITEKGQGFLSRLEGQADAAQIAQLQLVNEGCRSVKREYSDWYLPRLIRHVYQQFPAMTAKSTIRRRVLGR